MKYRALGHTGLQVSVASFGTGSLGEMFGPLAESDAAHRRSPGCAELVRLKGLPENN
jgi:aryl-alcohol dehydrogenase-like predicted oxidoreductase